MNATTPLWQPTLHRLIVFFHPRSHDTASETTARCTMMQQFHGTQQHVIFCCGPKNDSAECCGASFLAVAQRNTLRHDKLGHGTKNNGAAQCNMLQNAAANHFLPGAKRPAMLRHIISCHDTSHDTKNNATLCHGMSFCCHSMNSFAVAQRALTWQKELCCGKNSFAVA